MSAKIKKLSEEVINRIAAGEIVQRPYSAIKELLENSIDAGSDQISVLCIDSGFTRIEICDNGHGIALDDFPFLCERFATSKISEFNDLKSVSSFGFRGEALASISFVGDLTIKSKTSNSVLGFKAKFRDGKILEKSQEAIQMNPGTIIECDNLFYNLSVRRNSFSQREEFKEILKLMYKISIHHYNVKFNLRCSNEKSEFSSFNSLNKDKLKRIELISNIYKIPDHNLLSLAKTKEEYKISIEIICSEVGSVKKMREFHLFINERLVESEHIKKTVENTYKIFWNSIHDNEGGYYCYINLKMKQENIDVNVDPRKKYVKFVFEEEISNEIREILETKLKEKCSIRDYSVISIKSTRIPIVFKHESKNEDKKIIYDKNLVRVDPNTRKISSFFKEIVSTSKKDKNELKNSATKEFFPNLDELVFTLMKKNKDECDQETTKFFHLLCYVGCLNSNYILAQLEQNLYIINVIPMCLEIFYFKTLTNLQKFETYEVNMDIRDFLNSLLLKQEITKLENEEKIQMIEIVVKEKKNFLETLFSITIEENILITFPKIFDLPKPSQDSIFEFILLTFSQLKNSNSEIENISLMCRELSFIYAWSMESTSIYDEKQYFYNAMFKNDIIPFQKKCCLFPKMSSSDFSYLLLKLEDIYKIFERC